MTTGYVRGLDGLRAGAVLAVLATHSGWGWAKGGWLGVDIFFVLSGFLITTQLLKADWSLAEFMWRRLARLWPALLAMCALALILIPAGSESLGTVLAAGSYTYTPAMLIAHATPDNYVGHTWSLAVEMQFYIAWAIFMLAGRSWAWPRLSNTCLVLAAASLSIRAISVSTGHASLAYFATPAALTGLLVGAALAASPQFIIWRRPVLVGAGVATLAGVVLADPDSAWGLLAFSPLAVLFSVVAIAEIMAVQSGFFSRALEFRAASWLGVRSYSLYLWHYPLFALITNHSPLPRALNTAIEWALAIFVAHLSYLFVERPCRRWLNAHPPVVFGHDQSKRQGAQKSGRGGEEVIAVMKSITVAMPDIYAPARRDR